MKRRIVVMLLLSILLSSLLIHLQSRDLTRLRNNVITGNVYTDNEHIQREDIAQLSSALRGLGGPQHTLPTLITRKIVVHEVQPVRNQLNCFKFVISRYTFFDIQFEEKITVSQICDP